jgi:insulysin
LVTRYFFIFKKYPKENTFAKFIEENAGSTNAYTGGENTNYHFEISNEKLKDALDMYGPFGAWIQQNQTNLNKIFFFRFSQFFIKPLFDPDSTEREINAVNSENQKNLQIDGWRLYQFEKSLCKPSHPYSKFSTGNAETLKTVPESNGINIRDELIKFHGKYYSANLMNLVILSPQSLDTMQQYVDEMFTSVSNKNLEKFDFDPNPFADDTNGKIYYIVPVQEAHSLMLTFELPDYRADYKSNPTNYLSNLVGHEGPGSLLSELKAKGWANGIYAGGKHGARGFQFFQISVDLSEDGIKNVENILKLCFQYLNMVRNEGVHKWLVDETSELGKIKFEYKDKENPISYVSSLSCDMHIYDMDDALCGGYYQTKYEPNKIKEILGELFVKLYSH